MNTQHIMTNDLAEDAATLKAQIHQPIVLVGMMGVGKTSLGRKLSKYLDIPFYDSDELVEEKAGMSVADIFEHFGEDKFRQSEKNTILELMENEACVIATGGGAMMNDETRQAIKDKGLSIWLNASPENLLERIKSKPTRPLLQNDDPLLILKALIVEREAHYAEADLHLEQNNQGSGQIFNALIKQLYQHIKGASF